MLKIHRMMRFVMVAAGIVTVGWACATPTWAQSEPKAEQAPAAAAEEDGEKPEPTEKELFERFTKMMTKVRLIGLFTIDGKSMKDLNEETYEIRSAKKLPEKDAWLMTARIKYGSNDVTLPMILTVKWAGSTPMITLDDFTIPGMGTFSARVVFHDNKYAGTWTHDQVGGHLFGRLEPMPEEEDKKKSDKPK
jgi:hypothetical protein